MFIRPSLNKEQRDKEFLLRKELRERRNKGESVRFDGYPGDPDRKIVSSFFSGGNQEPINRLQNRFLNNSSEN